MSIENLTIIMTELAKEKLQEELQENLTQEEKSHILSMMEEMDQKCDELQSQLLRIKGRLN